MSFSYLQNTNGWGNSYSSILKACRNNDNACSNVNLINQYDLHTVLIRKELKIIIENHTLMEASADPVAISRPERTTKEAIYSDKLLTLHST